MLTIELVSPEAVAFTGEASLVVARTVDGGDVAFQPGHMPFIGSLAVWSVDVIDADGERRSFAVHRGFVQVSDDKVTVLSDVSEAAADIDVERATAALERARAALDADPADADAAAARARADLRLRVAGVG